MLGRELVPVGRDAPLLDLRAACVLDAHLREWLVCLDAHHEAVKAAVNEPLALGAPAGERVAALEVIAHGMMAIARS
jgi:hypothetical protein